MTSWIELPASADDGGLHRLKPETERDLPAIEDPDTIPEILGRLRGGLEHAAQSPRQVNRQDVSRAGAQQALVDSGEALEGGDGGRRKAFE